MSTPHPEGLGARAAMAQALTTSGLDAKDIDYINLHGTGTLSNDAAEGHAIHALFDGTPCSSTKGATGHTLGAAGALEAVITALALRYQILPAGINTPQPDPALALNYVTTNSPHDASRMYTALSNAFGFGGTNCSLVFGRADRARHGSAP